MVRLGRVDHTSKLSRALRVEVASGYGIQAHIEDLLQTAVLAFLRYIAVTYVALHGLVCILKEKEDEMRIRNEKRKGLLVMAGGAGSQRSSRTVKCQKSDVV